MRERVALHDVKLASEQNILAKFPSFSQWKQIFRVLSKGEKSALIIFFTLAVASCIFLATSLYLNNTQVSPKLGGTFVEGMVGQPRFINPLYGEINDVDRTLTGLVFSGIMTYDKNGNMEGDLAERYDVSSDGKTYTFTLRDNIQWHDRTPVTVDDIIFTIKAIQSPDYKSPLRANWIDVEVEKLSEKSFAFKLRQPYNSFIENCTVKILPQHIWKGISAESAALSIYNLQPVGSGPFEFDSLKQNNRGFIEELRLASNRKYYKNPSYIARINFVFFEKTDDVVRGANARQIDGFSFGSQDTGDRQQGKQISQTWTKGEKFIPHSFSLPRYFAVFFNGQKDKFFSDGGVRKAFIQSVHKNELLQKAGAESLPAQTGGDNKMATDSPVLAEFFGYKEPTIAYEYNVQKAIELVEKAGFKDNGKGQREKVTVKQPSFQFKTYLKVGSKGNEVTQLQACLAGLSDEYKSLLSTETNSNYGKTTEFVVTEFQKKYLPGSNPTGETGPGTRQKLNELCAAPSQNIQPLGFTLVTIDQPQLVKVAQLLAESWKSIGATVQVKAVNIVELKTIIKERDYDALLYGQSVGMEPDFYPFWYSSQKFDPGLNLSSYENKEADKLLISARQTLDKGQKQQYLEKLQDIILADAPALFLYNPDYIYWVSENVQGLATTRIADPSKRFVNITDWFIKTKRTWK